MVCHRCKGSCEIRDVDIVDERIYKYAARNGFLLTGRSLSIPYFVERVSQYAPFRKIPQYVIDFVQYHSNDVSIKN